MPELHPFGHLEEGARRHFISKLTDADGEQRETCHWVEIAQECGYLPEEESRDLLLRLQSLGHMLHSMTKQAHSFCRREARKRSDPP